MEKDEALKKLKDNGYNASIIDNMIYINEHPDNSKKIIEFMKQIGYNSSYGIRMEN